MLCNTLFIFPRVIEIYLWNVNLLSIVTPSYLNDETTSISALLILILVGIILILVGLKEFNSIIIE